MKRLSLLFLPLIFYACVGTKNINKDIVTPKSKSLPFDSINGTYTYVSVNTHPDPDLTAYAALTGKVDTTGDWRNGTVSFNQIDEKHLSVAFEKSGSTETRIIKGRIRDGAFYTKRKIKPIGVPFIVYFYWEHRAVMRKKDDFLLINYEVSRIGMIFILGAGNNEYYSGKYRKVK